MPSIICIYTHIYIMHVIFLHTFTSFIQFWWELMVIYMTSLTFMIILRLPSLQYNNNKKGHAFFFLFYRFLFSLSEEWRASSNYYLNKILIPSNIGSTMYPCHCPIQESTLLALLPPCSGIHTYTHTSYMCITCTFLYHSYLVIRSHYYPSLLRDYG